MTKVSCSAFHRNKAKQLEDLASIFEYNQICNDVSPLRKAAGQCRQKTERDKFWWYDIDRLLFYVDSNMSRHVIPPGVHDISVSLDVSVKGECGETDSIEDPFTDLSINIEIQGRKDKGRTLICAWHLDRHSDEHSTAAPEEVHPRYHFQFGGRGMEGLSELGDALILEPPRLAHPPLDGILATDFVLSNYCPHKWRKLRENSQYVNLVSAAQRVFWKPYAIIITDAWNQHNNKLKWHPQHVWPQLPPL